MSLSTMVSVDDGEHLPSGDYDNMTHNGDNLYLALPYRSGYVLQRSQQFTNRLQHGDAQPRKKKERKLSDRNEVFMSSLKSKDVSSVEKQLEKNPELTMYSDDAGISALSEAAKCGPQLLDAFLVKITEKRRLAIWIEHALLYAINANNYDSVVYLLDKREELIESEIRSHPVPLPEPSTRRKKKKSLETNNSMFSWSDRHKTQQHLLAEFEDAEFPVYLTPVVLAAKLHRVEILKLLLERPYASEIHPLTETCPLGGTDECEICREQRVFKSKREVEESRRLVEIYKALSSPTYILNSGVKDPIYEAFELSREMENLAFEDPPFKAEYDAVGKHCREFARDMLDLCRSTEEIETLLSYSKHSAASNTVELQRVIEATRYGQKEFVTHPSCQQVLQRRWYEGLPNWCCETEHRTLGFMTYVFLWCLFWPFACILFMLKVSPQLIAFMKHPINKFISDTISFAWFLALLIIESTNNRRDERAGDSFSITETLIIIWIAGMLARQIRMIWRHRKCCQCSVNFAVAAREFWRWYDMILLLCFIMWVVLHLIGVALAYSNGKQDVQRHEWDNWDLLLVSEGFFSLGTILSFVKLIGLFKANNSLGPLQISLKLMLNDILRFLLIFFITMTGFVMALTNIYSHYEGHVRIDEEAGDTRYQSDDLIKWRNTYKTLFWALFGYGDPAVADVVVNNINTDVDNNTTAIPGEPPEVVKHKLTESYGYIFLGTYHIVVIVVLINMLIAMMARSYEVIACNADLEWKYARTKLRMNYFNEVGSLPPPFNITIIGSVIKCFISCCSKCCECCDELYNTQRPGPVGDYQVLMAKLAKRYLSRQARKIKQEEQAQHLLSDSDLSQLADVIVSKCARKSGS